MTPTEEQLAALKRVAAYMDEMYSVASPYHGCTEDSDLLRAMIDSSEHFTDHTKMIGFDLERARGLRDFLQDDCAEVGDVWGEMIAEIERLRAENLELQVAVFGPDGIRANQACIIVDQAARISDLEIEITGLKADLEQSEEIKRLKDELENYGDHYACLLISKDAQIKELEGMLSIRTEELDIAHSVARSEKEMHEKELAAFARRIKELEGTLAEIRNLVPALIGPHGLAHYCAEQKVAKLVADDKIGPDAKPRSWQITDERIGLLEYCLETLLDAPDIEEIPGPGHSIEMLRAMLRETE